MKQKDIERIAREINKINKRKEKKNKEKSENQPFRPQGFQSHSMGFRGITENLQGGMKDITKGIQNLPHITIGKNKEKPQNIPSIPQNQPYPQQYPQNSPIQQQGLLNPKEQNIFDLIKKWGLILLALIVVVYAVYRIILVWI